MIEGEFVAENLSDKASTVEEYKQYLKDTHYDTNLNEWIENYLRDNTTVTNYPAQYLKNLKSVHKFCRNFNLSLCFRSVCHTCFCLKTCIRIKLKKLLVKHGI